jgi:hypothetical protein
LIVNPAGYHVQADDITTIVSGNTIVE